MRSPVRIRWAKSTPISLLMALALLGCWEEPPGMLEAGDEWASAEAWLEFYREVEDHPLLAGVEEVFPRMRDSMGAYADLYVLEMGRSPRALALPDGSILLSRSGLELCYEGVSLEEGDGRLAFLLGHELNHVANDDFWHASVFATLRGVGDEDERLRRLQDLLDQDGKNRQVLELKSDNAGILAAIQAGYDVAPVLQGDQTFFDEWTGGPDGSLAYADPSHPTPADRAEFLRLRLAEVAGQIDLFHKGVEAFREAEALAEGGRGEGLLPKVQTKYEEAVEHFERFSSLYFDGREVLSNLALAHLRLATQQLAECDGTLVNRYYLPTAIDSVTLAERTAKRGAGDYSSPCFDNDDYQRHIGEATRLLEEAMRRDPGYLPARLNLMAAFVIDEQPAQAANLANETTGRFPEDADAAEAWSAAYLAYLETGSSLMDPQQVLARIEELRQAFPAEPGIAFNLATYLSHAGRLDEAVPVWRDFLELEREGPWAEIAWDWVEGVEDA